MADEIKEMCLVSGEVTCKLYVNILIPKEDKENKNHLKELFKDRAFDDMPSADVEAECVSEIPVLLSRATADKLNYSVIGLETWSEIIEESTAIRDNR